MDWKVITDWISQFFDKPVVVWSSLIGEIGFFAVFVLAKTSIGKKALNALKGLYSKAEAEVEEANATLKAFKEEKESEIETLKAEYEKKLSVATDEVLSVEGLLSQIAEATPNRKIRETIETYLNGKEGRLAEITEKLPTLAALEAKEAEVQSIKDYLNASINALKAEYEAKNAQVAELLAKLNETAQEAVTEVSDG